jgi:hypothetical protein
MGIGESNALIIIGALLRFALTWKPRYVIVRPIGLRLTVLLAAGTRRGGGERPGQPLAPGRRGGDLDPRASTGCERDDGGVLP